MAKVWVLDTETKGTGANVVPLEKVQEQAKDRPPAPRRPPGKPASRRERRPPAKPGGAAERNAPVERTATPLPPGHVRKRSTGELGNVQAVDAKAGTVTVRWLRSGTVSTLPLSAVARR